MTPYIVWKRASIELVIISIRRTYSCQIIKYKRHPVRGKSNNEATLFKSTRDMYTQVNCNRAMRMNKLSSIHQVTLEYCRLNPVQKDKETRSSDLLFGQVTLAWFFPTNLCTPGQRSSSLLLQLQVALTFPQVN